MTPSFFIFFFQGLNLGQVIPVEGEPAGDDYNSRRRRRQRGLRPDPFEQWPDEEAPQPWNEPAGYPPPPPPRTPPPWAMTGGVSASSSMSSPDDSLTRMLGGVTQGMEPRGPKVQLPWEDVPDDPAAAEMVRRMLRI